METRVKVLDKTTTEIYTNFTFGVIPREGEIIQMGTGKQFAVETVLHRAHDITGVHIVEVHIGEELK